MQSAQTIRALLTPEESRALRSLNSPRKIQDFLDTLPINFEISGETYMSPRRVLRTHTAHCFEGALLAAAALAYHGERPLLLDLKTTPEDEDHVVTLFKEHGRWGAISKTNHVILRYRDPVYESVRELAMSYFHEYQLSTGHKTLRAFSEPFDLTAYPLESWLSAEEELEWLVQALDDSKHFPIAPKENLRLLRKSSPVERKALEIVEWEQPTGSGE